MKMKKKRIKLCVPNLPEYVTLVRMIVAGLSASLNARLDATEELKMAVSEACNHIITETKKKNIEIEFEVRDRDITVCFVNYYPEKITNKGRNLLERELSRTFINTFMDKVRYGKNLVMAKRLA